MVVSDDVIYVFFFLNSIWKVVKRFFFVRFHIFKNGWDVNMVVKVQRKVSCSFDRRELMAWLRFYTFFRLNVWSWCVTYSSKVPVTMHSENSIDDVSECVCVCRNSSVAFRFYCRWICVYFMEINIHSSL